MRVAVLGATGPTGQLVVKEALQDGHEVVAMVRNPDKLTTKHDQLRVEKADILCVDSLATHFAGCDVVLSCLGAQMVLFGSITLLHDSCQTIVPAMRRAGVRKLVTMSSMYAKDDETTPFMVKWVFKPLLLGRHLADMARMEEYLVGECQDVNFTVVKPPQLTDAPYSDHTMLAEEGQAGSGGWMIPRANVARFLVNQVTDDFWSRKLVTLSLPS